MGNSQNPSMLKGIIDQSSTVLSLPTGGLKMTEDEVKNLWNTYDTDGSGELSNNEIDKFILDLLSALEKRELDVLGELFNDDKKTLQSESKEIKALYKKLKEKKANIVHLVDANGDGNIQFNEFVNYLNTFKASDVKNLLK